MLHLLSDPEFWVLVAVAILVALLWKPGKRMLVGGLDSRAERIRTELETVRGLREEAERALASYEARQRQTAQEAEQLIAHAKAEADRIAAESARALEESLERRRRLAEERIAQEEARALAQIRAATVDVAVAAARRVIAAGLDGQQSAALIDDAIRTLPQQLQ